MREIDKLKTDLDKYEHELATLMSLRRQLLMLFDATIQIKKERIKEIKNLLASP